MYLHVQISLLVFGTTGSFQTNLLTPNLLVAPADNIYKQFGPRSDPTKRRA